MSLTEHGPADWGELAIEKVRKNRSLFCPEYESCLEKARRLFKRGWTCRYCERFPERDHWRAEEAKRQAACSNKDQLETYLLIFGR